MTENLELEEIEQKLTTDEILYLANKYLTCAQMLELVADNIYVMTITEARLLKGLLDDYAIYYLGSGGNIQQLGFNRNFVNQDMTYDDYEYPANANYKEVSKVVATTTYYNKNVDVLTNFS